MQGPWAGGGQLQLSFVLRGEGVDDTPSFYRSRSPFAILDPPPLYYVL